MAAIKSRISAGLGFLVILCSVQHSIQDCDRPTNLDPNIIIVPDKPTYAQWNNFVPSCSTGYDKTGPNTYYCSTDYDGSPDYWSPLDTSPATLSCSAQGVPCPKPNFTDSAVVITPEKGSYDTHEQVTASCSSGTLQGDDVGECLSDGTWDFTTEPSCLLTCLRPTNLDPNLVIDPDMTSYGDWAHIAISCPPDYEMAGPDSSYCYPDGTWNPNPDFATCTELCSKPNFTDPAMVITPEKVSYDPGERVTASCSSGTLLGDDAGSCLSDGTWDFTTDPSCLIDCQAPPNSNGTSSYPHASEVTFACIEGFTLDTGGDSVAATCDDGAWTPPFTCGSFGCSPPSVPPKATIEDPQSDPYKYNSRVIMKCIGDRTLSGPAFSYCNKTGQWNPDPMTIKCLDQCVTPSFDDPKIIHTSQLSGSSGQSFYDHSDTIRFSCEGGIFVDGPWKAACHDGTWFPHIGGHRPVCKNNCTAPENMSNAGAVFQHSDSHVFGCDGTPGMMRMGGPRSVCKHGVWTPRIRCALNKDLRSEP